MKRARLSAEFVCGATVLAAMLAVAALAPLLSPGNPLFATAPPMQAPGWDYPFGTDFVGRSVLAMMIWGVRVSLLFAFGAAGISLLVGVLLGALSGYFGGLIDDALSRLFEIFFIIPRLFLIILVIALFGSQLWLTVIVVGVTIWPSNARIMRAQVLALKQRGYVQAALVAGGGHLDVIFGHIVPNGIAPVLANSTLQMAYAVLIEAGLSFLGLGDPNVASWGQLLYWGQSYLASAPWMVIFPGAGLALLLLSLHLMGSALQNRLNPRLQQAYT
jgi:peptide/nickel transport system permease protein